MKLKNFNDNEINEQKIERLDGIFYGCKTKALNEK